MAVKRKADLPNGAFLFFPGNPVPDAKLFQPFPRSDVGQHMHQIIVDIVRLQPPQLFLKAGFDGLGAGDLVLRQLGRNMHLLPKMIPGKDFAQTGLVAHV